MINTLKNIILMLDQGKDLGKDLNITNQDFSNEIIFHKDLSSTVLGQVNLFNCDFEDVNLMHSYFINCNFENCKFDNTMFHKSEFWNCTFENCEMIGCGVTKVNFYTNIFTRCQFKKVNLGWSSFRDCELIETKFNGINFEGAAISNLKTKNITFLNLQFDQTFPIKFYKSGSIDSIKIKDDSDFERLLKDSDNLMENGNMT